MRNSSGQTTTICRLIGFAGLALLSASCTRNTLKLMPTPLVHQYLGESAYKTLPDAERRPEMEIFFATNRPASGPVDKREYGNGIVDSLQLGTATVRIGERGTRWQDLLVMSTLHDRIGKIPVELDAVRELDALPGSDGSSFADRINAVIAERRRPEITLYVHGASSSFFRSITQGAQFHHFMAHQTALLSYSWPSTGKFISYKKDVEFAKQSAGNLADLIEYLADNTRARKINLLVYSAGGQVVAPALAQLRQRYPDVSDAALQQRFRLGEIYFAAADVSLDDFVDSYLPTFEGMVDRTTVTFHTRDKVLKLAQNSNDGVARLGRPLQGELSPEQIRSLEKLAREGKLDAINMEYSNAERPVNFRAHGVWYLNEWVSSDAILQFLLHADPRERGLEKKPGSEAWYFPADYPQFLKRLADEARAAE
ncbi:MAG: alpha/beta hydrolase [Verrucomicrobiales bacterium]